MKPGNCNGCGACVLEVDGQFENLDSFYLDQDGPPEESAGEWHTSCLLASPYGSAWHDARLKNHTMVRGYQLIASTQEWSVIRHPRTEEVLALSRKGSFLALTYASGRARKVEGGSIYPVSVDEYNLELEDEDVVRTMQEALTSAKTFPVLALFEALGLADRLHHPEALEGSLIHFSRPLQRYWSDHFVSARWDHGVYVPAELEQYVTKSKRRA